VRTRCALPRAMPAAEGGFMAAAEPALILGASLWTCKACFLGDLFLGRGCVQRLCSWTGLWGGGAANWLVGGTEANRDCLRIRPLAGGDGEERKEAREGSNGEAGRPLLQSLRSGSRETGARVGAWRRSYPAGRGWRQNGGGNVRRRSWEILAWFPPRLYGHARAYMKRLTWRVTSARRARFSAGGGGFSFRSPLYDKIVNLYTQPSYIELRYPGRESV